MTATAPGADGGARPERQDTGRGALLVGAGILLSRVVGLVRERAMGHYFGDSGAADAFRAAFKIPNLLQNLFGEGALSASFIPVYAGLLARRDEDAGRVAGAVLALLAVVTSVLVALGVAFTPTLIDVIAPGFVGDRRDLTIRLVRVLFPGAGLLVLSAWCLGVLNSHRRFFLSYAASVVWNVAMIATLLGFGPRLGQDDLAVALAWGSVVGSLAVFLVQVPSVRAVEPGLVVRLDLASVHVRSVARSFVPAFLARGVVQISAYVDQILASWLPIGAVAGLGYAQTLATLPVSLFGMAVSAAELPEMSSAVGGEAERAAWLRGRLDAGLRRIAFFVVPSAMAFLALGDVVVGVIYQSGRFTYDVTTYVWGILAGSAVGLLASTLGRLYASTFYALRDTRTPLRFATIRVVLTVALGWAFAFPGTAALGLDPRWGAAGLTASAGVAGWIEFALLRRALAARIGPTSVPLSLTARLWLAAGLAGAVGAGLRHLFGHAHPLPVAAVVLGAYGAVYFGVTAALRVPESGAVLRRVRAKLLRR